MIGESETLWGRRRRETARRRRALLIVAAALGLLDLGMGTLVAADGIGTYRIVTVPEANGAGRAIPIDEESTRAILEGFEAVRDEPTAVAAGESKLEPWKEASHAAALAPGALP
ncbi:MAG: hypothetical protein A3F84_29445 [Candidatus Handelsmanbacteria bacterium RIFCSPLOWO2_12_FULL_64_10]|uniref:Uncharacterized protein n=1 Tax=Handelsmanbacteria sp. (strain RIFCSPLOWO2_12_FULL_64_10) TaxID=1817868 RepID=A0A1F6CBN6_HANXR|nr:MAG: hypothetical protein A3F84_29445 [Candidatus Handelsmanbacteria bacterium RIFCSPLOWO2_12_FULL_64_10]